MNFWDWFWKDNKGEIVIAQPPNRYIVTWLLLTIAAWASHRSVAEVFSLLAFIALVIWSYLEITDGVNGFRKTLGVAVLVGAIIQRLA